MDKDRFAQLADKLLNGNISAGEREELGLMLEADPKLAEELGAQLSLDALLRAGSRQAASPSWRAVRQRIHRRPVRLHLRWSLAAAACLLLVLGGRVALKLVRNLQDSKVVATAARQTQNWLEQKNEKGEPPLAVPALVWGDVYFRRQQGELRVHVPPAPSGVWLRFTRRSGDVRLGSGSKLALREDAEKRLVLELSAGETDINMPGGGKELVVLTAAGRLSCSGGRFWVRLIGEEELKNLGLKSGKGGTAVISVLEGTVKLAGTAGTLGGGEWALLTAGENPQLLFSPVREEERSY